MSRLADMLAELALAAGKSRAWASELSIGFEEVVRGANLVSGWVGPGGTDPSFETVFAHQATFGSLPGALGRTGTNTVQAIPTSTWTTLKPMNAAAAFTRSHNLTIDTVNGAIEMAQYAETAAWFFIWGHAQFALNTTGRRSLGLYNTDGTEIMRWGEVDAESSSETILEGNMLWRVAGATPDNMELRVWQNSGGNLDVGTVRFVAWRVR